MKFRRTAAALTAAALTLGLSACAATPTAATPSPAPDHVPASQRILRLGVMYSADVVPLAVMLDQGMDAANGFSLDMQVFQSAKDRDAALQAGALDGVFTDYIGVCIYQNAGLDVKITGVTDGDYVLLAGPDAGITSMDDLKGSIAISENTLIEYSLDFILADNGYEPTCVRKEIVPRIPDRLEMLRAGRVDLGLLPDPFSTLAAGSGAIRLGSANDAGLYPAVMGFLQSAIDEKKDVLRHFSTAYDQAVEYVNATPLAEFEDVAITGAGFPEELKGQVALPQYRTSQLPGAADLQSAIDWAENKGLCRGLTPERLVAELG